MTLLLVLTLWRMTTLVLSAFSLDVPVTYGALSWGQAFHLLMPINLAPHVPLPGGTEPVSSGLFVSCDDRDEVHLFLHRNHTIRGVIWGTAARRSSAQRAAVCHGLRDWHRERIEEQADRALDAQLYLVDDVRAWWGLV